MSQIEHQDTSNKMRISTLFFCMVLQATKMHNMQLIPTMDSCASSDVTNPHNAATYAQMLQIMDSVEDLLIDCLDCISHGINSFIKRFPSKASLWTFACMVEHHGGRSLQLLDCSLLKYL